MTGHTLRGPDTNGVVAGLLRDLAAIQSSQPRRWAYSGAAATIFGLGEPLEALVRSDGTLPKLPGIGPKSERVVLEVLRTGASPTVERAVAESGKIADIERRRQLRDNFLSRAQVVHVLRGDVPNAPAVADYRGDFQTHSTWSDGSQSLDDLVGAALARGYLHSAATDHSHGLRIARGMSMEDVSRQGAEIDRVNREQLGRFRLIKGIETNIAADGSIDVPPGEFELVLAAPHSGLRTSDDQTARMLRVVETPGVHILGHPRGRMYGARAGVVADWDAVFAAAVRANVAIEIDGDPMRQDIDYVLARRAVESGCLFALNSDAHSPRELLYAETAIAHARLAGVPRERVLNSWSTERLLDWLAR